MIDIHSHLLFNVDDGADNIKESFEMIKKASKIGYHTIVVTPHYISNSKFNSDLSKNVNKFEQLQFMVRHEKIPVKLLLGNEAYFEADLIENIENKVVSTLNKTRYVLMEIPRHEVVFNSLLNFVFQLQVKGFAIILAHPERYVYLDINKVNELIQRDVLMQLNLSSLVGYYGKEVKKVAFTLLDHNMIHFVGTDAHTVMNYQHVPRALKELKNRVGTIQYAKVVESNAKIILADEMFYPDKPIEIKKKNMFEFIKRKKK